MADNPSDKTPAGAPSADAPVVGAEPTADVPGAVPVTTSTADGLRANAPGEAADDTLQPPPEVIAPPHDAPPAEGITPAPDAAPAAESPSAAGPDAAPVEAVQVVLPFAVAEGAPALDVPPAGAGSDEAPDENQGTAPLPTKAAEVPAGLTAATAPTEILPFDMSVLHPLPDGAVLDGRYVVRGLIGHNQALNVYRAIARDQQRCPDCGALAPRDLAACARCGAALSGQEPQPSYLITEARDPETLLQDPAVIERGLNHPNLIPLVDGFSYAPYGPERAYTVAEGHQGVALNQLALPQPADQVLAWGTQLSDALRYLHREGVLSPGATPNNVLIKEDAAVLANLQNARPASDDPAVRAREFADDVAGLAGTLYETLTGVYASTAGRGRLLPDSFPPQVEEAFARALRPAPGAPPITAEEWHDLLVNGREALNAAAPSLRIRSGRISDVGRHRPLNEDSLAGIECQVVQESHSAGIGVYAVADGMGGHAGGEIASALAISSVTEILLARLITPAFAVTGGEPAGDQVRGMLAEAVQSANARIHQERVSRGTDMGTTLVAALVSGQKVYIANVGDSRAYLLTTDEENTPRLKQITVDHSLVQRLVSMGQITADEAKYHPYRNMIYKSLGERPQVELDMFVERIVPGMRLLLCSDGLSGMVPDPRIAEILAAESDPQLACQKLVAAANQAGGSDNITAIAIYVEPA
jgi:serine/threonine protein phosphatase PrpC